MLWITKVPYRVRVRWNDLFADLEGQFATAANAEFDADVEELSVAERASVTIAARLRAARGDEVTLRLEGGTVVRGTPTDATPAWVLIRDGRREHLVPTAAIAGVSGLSDRSLPWGEVEGRLSFGHALRLLRDASAKVVLETSGGEFRGSIVAVGADHCDVIFGTETEKAAVPFAAIRRVTSA